MSIPRKLEKFLRRNRVFYEIVVHPHAFSASETAAAEHAPGSEVAKVVMVKIFAKDAMIVVPASCSVDLLKLETLTGDFGVRVQEEREFANLFADCDPGAMPPFGALYGIPCYVDEKLKDVPAIYFNAGNHKESIKVATEDFFRVVKAKIADLSVPGHMIAA